MAMSLTGLGQGRGAMEGIAIAYPIFLVVSVVSGHSVGMGASGGTAFSGLTGSKNLLAGDALAGVLACLAAAFSSFEAGKTARSMVFGGAAIGAVFVMLLARSSGSILTLLLIGPMMIGMLFVRNGPAALRSVAVIVIVLVAITASAFAQPLTDWATDIAMSVFHKDPTLTGRLYLWQRSADIIKERPWLGVGYNAFWVQGHIDAEGLWRWGGIQSRGGFNFHNTVLEVLVHFGYIGLGILIVSLSTCVAMFARLFILGASVLQVYWLAALACMMVSIGWESYLPTPFNSSSFTVLAAFCAACSSPYLPRSPLGVNRRVRRLGGN